MSDHVQKPKVSIRHGGSPAEMAVGVLSEAVSIDIKGKRILIKPNIGFRSEPAAGIVTHPEVVAGAVRWARQAGAAEILVGDSCIYGVDAAEAFALSGIQAAAEREGARMVLLDETPSLNLAVPNPFILDTVKVTSLVQEVDLIMSVPVIKSHMHTGATLSLKNMKGILHRREKMRMHHLKHPDESGAWAAFRTLDCAIADLTSAVMPAIVLLDAMVVMEGMGPLIGDPRRVGAVLACEDALAADLVGLELIGFTAQDVPHIKLAAIKQGRPAFSLADIDVDRDLLASIRTPLRPAIPEDISSSYPYFRLTHEDACSACDSTVMAFLKTYGAGYAGKDEVQIVLGKGVTEDEIKLARCVILGNCAAKHRKRGTFLTGCPPIPSDIKKALE
jgi:uncharacterized protein (DUF362 family)